MGINWHDMFIVTIPLIIEKMIRPVLIYAFLIIGIRLAGKRELAQLNPFDWIVLLTLSNTVQNAIIGNDNTITGGIIGAATLLAINSVFVRFLHHHKKLETLVEGHRDYLVRDGHLNRAHLEHELMTRAELLAAAHRQGLSSLADVQDAILEPTGTITFIAKTPGTDDLRHHEILDTLERLRQELTAKSKGDGAPGTAH